MRFQQTLLVRLLSCSLGCPTVGLPLEGTTYFSSRFVARHDFKISIKFEVEVSISARGNRKRLNAPMNFYLDDKNDFGHLLALVIPAPSK